MDENKVLCERCGASWAVNQEKRHRTDLLCFSCRIKPATVIQYGTMRCVPWAGDFAKDGVTPMFQGQVHMPGERICGHLDCVNVRHLR